MRSRVRMLYLFFMLLISSFMGIKLVNAAELTTSFSGYYWDRTDADGHEWTGSFKYYYLDGVDSYCLNPNKHEGSPLDQSDWTSINISDDLKKEIALIAYYGYNYPNHQTLEYRAATQALIWEKITGNGNKVIFTTQYNGLGNELNIDKERKQIERLISIHNILPSFSNQNYKVEVGQTLMLQDTNKVLGNYNITVDSENYNINGNILFVTPSNSTPINISLSRKDPYFAPYKIFVSETYQDQIVPGTVDNISKTFKVEPYTVTAKVKITKVNYDTGVCSAKEAREFVGTKYQILDKDRNVVDIVTIGDDCIGISNDLPYGQYQVREYEPPEGYTKDYTDYVFSINSTVPINITSKEKPIKGKVKIQKFDSKTNRCLSQGDASLVGAKYQIFDSNNNLVETLTIGDDCTAISTDLLYGNYTVKEIESSKGYKLDNNTYQFKINNNDELVSLTSKEDIINSKIKITKVDFDNNICTASGQALLVGAKYQIFDSNNNLVETLVIGDDCTVISNDLPYGEYTIKEIEEPIGYELDTNIYKVKVEKDNEIINVVSKDKVIKNHISILKQYNYLENNQEFLKGEEGIIFEIYDKNEKKYFEVITDKNGYIKLDLPYGIWIFHQVNTTSGYDKIDDFEVVVDKNSEKEHYYNLLDKEVSAYLKLIKIDSETKKTINISGVSFKILNLDKNEYVKQFIAGKYLDTFYTDNNGEMLTYLALGPGNYKILEASSPKGYLLSDDNIYFTIDENTSFEHIGNSNVLTLYFENKPLKGKVELLKTGEDFFIEDGKYNYREKSLKGIKFRIYAAEDIYSSDGQILYYSKNKLVDYLETDEDGDALSNELPLGKYYLKETKTLDGYVLDNEKYYFEIKEENNITPIVYITYNLKNYLKKGKLELTKIDSNTKETIPNTKIRVYTENDDLIYEGKTNEKGKIILDNLVLGKYYFREVEPNPDYKLNDEKIFFEITKNNQKIKLTMTNEKNKRNLEFKKIDLMTGSVLPNTKIEIYDIDNKLIYEGMTDDEGMITINDLEVGKYYILEKEAPIGYKINREKLYFEIDNEETVKVTMANDKIKSLVRIKKIDENKNSLANVIIGIYDMNDKLIYEDMTDETGYIECELEYGKYYYKEIETVDGFILDEQKVFFDINKEATLEFELINKLEYIDVPNTEKNSLSFYFLPYIFMLLGIGYLNVKEKF